MTSYSLQYNVNGGSWIDVPGASAISISGASATIASVIHNEASLAVLGTNTIQYRAVVVNTGEANTNSATQTINFRSRSYFGYSTNTSLNSSQVIGLGNSTLATTRARSFSAVTASGGNYVYYAYPSSFGTLSGIVLDGSTSIYNSTTQEGAFANSTVSVTNPFGITENYLVWRSNAVNAFINNTLAFS